MKRLLRSKTIGAILGFIAAAPIIALANISLSSSGAVSVGGTISGGTNNRFVVSDGSAFIQTPDSLIANVSGTGNFVYTFLKSPTGGSATSNAINLTGTNPAVLTAAFNYINLQLTGAGSSGQSLSGINIDHLAGFTGAAEVAAIRISQSNTATGNPSYGIRVLLTSGAAAAGNASIYGETNTGSNSSAIRGSILNFSGNQTAGWFSLGAIAPPAGIYPFGASNGTQAQDICRLYDNITLKIQCLDGGHLALLNMSNATATMALETDAQARTTTHSYTWSNAQVVALGAVTVGDITVATIPAKTRVKNAYVVITGAAVGPATVTVSCGDAIGGTPFINYVVASDAKAAANTVYGDAVAERGTSIDVEWYYLPSYTATTLVTCHFISSGANLNTVTGSTGRVIIETELLP